MDINLYYIHGISRIDTPYFAKLNGSQASINKQEEFFSNHLVQSVELSFYPPHYRNVIRFDSEDVTINTNINYLSFVYQDKTYYYFIDSINYVSETIIELEITMDVIQTYMFDIEISNGIIERKFINRWYQEGAVWKINRNYVRENVSDNEYTFNNINIVNSDVSQWLVFIPCTKYVNLSNRVMDVKYNVALPGLPEPYTFTSSYPTFILPFIESYYTGVTYAESASGEISTSTNVEDKQCWIGDGLSLFTSMNTIVDMYVCPFNCARDLDLDEDNHVNEITFTQAQKYIVMNYSWDIRGQTFHTLAIAPKTTPTSDMFFIHTTFYSDVKTGTYKPGGSFARNSSIGTSYSSNKMPMMLDENYIRYQFGSLSSFTTIPLYKLLGDNVRWSIAFNPTDGTRIYWLNDDYVYSVVDPYNTVVIDTNVLRFDLKNDPWVNYVSQNRNRWAVAGINTAVDIFTKGMSNGLRNKFAKQDIISLLSDSKSFDKRYKLPHLKKKPGNQLKGLQRDIESNNMDTGLSSLNSFNSNIISQAIQDANVQVQPPSPKQISNISGITAKDGYIMNYVERVIDYEQCAQYYHRNGYLVNEYINIVENIFDYVQNRYYFNMLKMAIPNVHLRNVIEDEDTCEAIKDRLIDGVRLWNVNNTGVTIGDFQYDNVENDYVS